MFHGHPDRCRSAGSIFLAATLVSLASCAASAAGSLSDAKNGADEASAEKDTAFELALAELELEKAQLESEQGLAKAELALKLATGKLVEAQATLAAFNERGKVIDHGERKLAVDRTSGRAEDAAAELAELEAMYAEEEFAEKTKELVLTRGRRALTHSKRQLELENKKLEKLVQVDQVIERQKLERGLQEAEGKVEGAKLAVEIAKLEGRVGVEKAAHKLKKARDKDED